MKLFILVILFFTLLLTTLPKQGVATFYTQAKPLTGNSTGVGYFPNTHNSYHHIHHFKGRHTHAFCRVLGLGCSIVGSVAVVAALTAVIVAALRVFVIAAYGFSLLGIVLGFISLSDSDGSTAVVLGSANLLVLWLGGAIYQATLGNFVPLLKLAAVFVK